MRMQVEHHRCSAALDMSDDPGIDAVHERDVNDLRPPLVEHLIENTM